MGILKRRDALIGRVPKQLMVPVREAKKAGCHARVEGRIKYKGETDLERVSALLAGGEVEADPVTSATVAASVGVSRESDLEVEGSFEVDTHWIFATTPQGILPQPAGEAAAKAERVQAPAPTERKP